MNIRDYFKELKLTTDQQNVLDELVRFVGGDNRAFLLKGYAGTGKTTLLKGICKFLSNEKRLGQIMAPTGRAAKVIEDKTGFGASTIHKAIYSMDDFRAIEKENSGEKSYKFIYGLNHNLHDVNKIFIVDEASMVGNHFSEGEFFRFGSGHLLADLLKYVDLTTNKNHKILFVGDPAQLPLVGSKDPVALTQRFFQENGIGTMSVEMKQVVRQARESGILQNAGYYRGLIFSDKVAENKVDVSFNDVREINIQDVKGAYLTRSPSPDLNKNIIITFSNALALTYNKIIRHEYFPGRPTVAQGDILQVVQNNYSNRQLDLMNGDFVKVTEVSGTTETQSAPIYIQEKKQTIGLRFRDVRIRHSSGTELSVKIIDSLLNSKRRELSTYEKKALYVNFIVRSGLKPKGPGFSKALKADPYFNALQVKYGYAITGHKSQGGEWENAFVDFSGRIGTSKEVLRWSYTAITRAEKKLFVINPPKLEQIDFSNIKATIGRVNKFPANAFVFPKVEATPWHNDQTHPAKRLKFFEIEEKLFPEGFKIKNIRSQEYQETYTIGLENEDYVFDLYHNRSGLFTTYTASQKSETSDKLLEILKKPVPWEYYLEYEPQNTALEKLHQNMLSAMQGLNINIMGIDDSTIDNYYVSYFFRTDGDAYFQVFVKKNGKVSSIIAKSTLGENDEELRELLENLKKQH